MTNNDHISRYFILEIASMDYNARVHVYSTDDRISTVNFNIGIRLSN